MNKNKLKTYAPKAREEFIKIVTERAALYGITAKKITPCEIKGDYAFISGKPFPKSVEKTRDDLVKRIEAKGFTQVMEEVAYTWFNRFAAIRFMEINGYLLHGYRVLSHPDGHSEPEILSKAQYLNGLDGLGKDEIVSLKTAGNKDAELYRKLIIAQCNELHSAMPFLFERVDDPTELLLPDNLLNTDSVIRQMVVEIPEEDWKQVEIIGWLYQFYISEKKDVLLKAKKAYKTEDIPTVTQLFTPNWIVKYLVQNSLGAKWLATYPSSGIKSKMEYYIEPAEQTDKVKQQLKEITPASLNPEELTVMDPACGSGHILAEAYNLIKDIYLERGYRTKDIPALILTKNLFGLEIDDRAAQLAGFALMMKARQDDRQIFGKQIKPNILVLKSASGRVKVRKESEDINQLIDLFENASTFGSLIQVPEELIIKLSEIKNELLVKRADISVHDVFTGAQYYEDLLELVQQADFLSRRYDFVIANPPYMGGKAMNAMIKELAKTKYPSTKADLFAMFIERGIKMVNDGDCVGFVTPYVWMFISSYKDLREMLINENSIISLIKPSYTSFFESAIVALVTFIVRKKKLNYLGNYFDLEYLGNAEDQPKRLKEGISTSTNKYRFQRYTDSFTKIPVTPIAYWVTDNGRAAYDDGVVLEEICPPRQGLATTDNNLFLKRWQEVQIDKIKFDATDRKDAKLSKYKWFPYNKGGEYRRWFGNNEFIVNWKNDGEEIKKSVIEKYPYLNGNPDFVTKNQECYFKAGITWTYISTSYFGVRYSPAGFIFDVAGSSVFPDEKDLILFLSFMSSIVATYYIKAINPTINIQAGNVGKLPIKLKEINRKRHMLTDNSIRMIDIAKSDWDSSEISWDYNKLPILKYDNKVSLLNESFCFYREECKKMTIEMKSREEENNKFFIETYGLQDALSSSVPVEEITLFANPKYRYKGDLTEEETEGRFKADTMKEMISYSIGCMMGRYSLDKPGLIYAHCGNEGFDAAQYKKFQADDDGIVPITDHEWFDDDAACRFFKFIETAWDKKGLDSNLDFIAGAIGRKANEFSREAIRRYFVDGLYKDHCQTYKKRPIYWLFTSGKEKAFQALVYLHRYNEGTLARMRTEYVLPLQTKINRHIEHLEKDKDSASSTSAANKIQKEITSLLKQKDELIKFDERLRHYADMKIKLNLDDGVKVNYEKFDDLVAKI